MKGQYRAIEAKMADSRGSDVFVLAISVTDKHVSLNGKTRFT